LVLAVVITQTVLILYFLASHQQVAVVVAALVMLARTVVRVAVLVERTLLTVK
jgi:hypothetical protein